MESLSGSVLSDLEPDFTAALDDSNHDSLVAFEAMPDMPTLTADKGFVSFNDSTERLCGGLGLGHSFTDTMAEIPSCSIGDVKSAFQLIGRDAFLGIDHHVRRKEPLLQR